VEALSALRPAGGLEIILVNDGSPDASGAVCRELAARATVPLTYLEHARNFGEHNAVMTGLRHARGAYVITMDDDLQNPPEEVVKLYDHARLGAGTWSTPATPRRSTRAGATSAAASPTGGGHAARQAEEPLPLLLPLHERLVVREVTKYSGPYPYVDGLIMQVTQRIDSIEVLHLARAEGRSNYTIARLVRLWLNLATNFSVLPLRLAIFAGRPWACWGSSARRW
jgi:undecaprenyl-phosphate 4-deoxy-4-formamido-L-arabinose transferase